MSLFVVICVFTTCVRRVPSSSVSPMVSFCTEKAAVLLLVHGTGRQFVARV